ncbi:thioredoxin [Lactiplantibacillus carotarum]|uniref:thioredoxin n=1 Tax=Lactiplantibacillus carotarum TaxID=2993456 RepID=UPI00298ED70F|nr:thioredoxin [Lactiplantibacillus carotarum]
MIEPVDATSFATVADDTALTVVDFWADWCGPCKMQTPVLEALDEAYDGQIKFASLDVDQYQEIAEHFEIMSIPALVVFKNGQPAEKVVGFHPQAALKKYLDQKLVEATSAKA